MSQLWRYPVKSIGGEQLDRAEITEAGIRHDRGWGLVDDPTGTVLTARREPRLLLATASIIDDAPWCGPPTGGSCARATTSARGSTGPSP
ncbi:MAG: MOSC N-terminal beta barrel domain-containing protein [Acidimicrobiales bacterium]